MNPLYTNNLVIVTEEQFEYILDLYQAGIPLETNVIQDFLSQCEGSDCDGSIIHSIEGVYNV